MNKLKIGDKLIVAIDKDELGDIFDNRTTIGNFSHAKIYNKLSEVTKKEKLEDLFFEVQIKSISHKVKETKIKQVKEYVVESNEDDEDWDF